MALLPGTRKDRTDHIADQSGGCLGRSLRRAARKVWPDQDRSTHRKPQQKLKSHRLIIRPATALWGNPGDVAVGILDIAGFAVDAVLRVDDELRLAGLLDPFIDSGRTVPVRWSGENVVLGRLLQLHVG